MQPDLERRIKESTDRLRPLFEAGTMTHDHWRAHLDLLRQRNAADHEEMARALKLTELYQGMGPWFSRKFER